MANTIPIVTIIEAKKSDISLGLGQCVAEMMAAKIFNEKENTPKKIIYGIVTTALEWQMMSLENKTISLENRTLSLDKLSEILGVLLKIIEV